MKTATKFNNYLELSRDETNFKQSFEEAIKLYSGEIEDRQDKSIDNDNFFIGLKFSDESFYIYLLDGGKAYSDIFDNFEEVIDMFLDIIK